MCPLNRSVCLLTEEGMFGESGDILTSGYSDLACLCLTLGGHTNAPKPQKARSQAPQMTSI